MHLIILFKILSMKNVFSHYTGIYKTALILPFGLQSLKYLLSGPLQDKFVLREPTVYQAVSQVLYTHYLILATTL